MSTKREWLRQVKTALARGDLVLGIPGLSDVPESESRTRLRWLADAIHVPRKHSSVVARSKQVENRVAKYLWGDGAWRTWKDREDIRNDDLRMIGEVKSVLPEQMFHRGGPAAILEAALQQVADAVIDAEDAGDLWPGYAPFSVLVPVGVRDLGRSLVMIYTVSVGFVMLPLERFRTFGLSTVAQGGNLYVTMRRAELSQDPQSGSR